MPAESTLLLATLFVVAAAAGWAFARYSDSRERHSDAAQLSADYYRGLNYLLNQKPDEALEVFLRMKELDDEAVETQLLLGSLFRRRGEVDKAIKIHQNLVERADVTGLQRDQSVFALGEDFLKAGLLDRAEELFEKLSKSPTHSVDALEGLVNIYEQEREWANAITARQKLESLLKPDGSQVIAHYHCELAEEARTRKNFDLARQHLKRARTGRHRTARGAMMRGDIARAQGDCSLALKLYRRTLKQDPELLSEILPRAMGCFEAAGEGRIEKFAAVLDSWLAKIPALNDQLAYAGIVNAVNGIPVIDSAVISQVRDSEILLSLFPAASGEVSQTELKNIGAVLHKLVMRSARFQCRNCGFSGTTLYWQCPSCKGWDTIRPLGHLIAEHPLAGQIDIR